MSQFSNYWEVVRNFNAENTYYVSSRNGNDGNPGTKAQPFETLTHALTVVSPRDAICIVSHHNTDPPSAKYQIDVPNIMIYNGQLDEAGQLLSGFNQFHIQAPKVMCAGLPIGTVCNLDLTADFTDGFQNMLDDSGLFPVWDDTPALYDAYGSVIYRCVLGEIFKPPVSSIYWNQGGPIKSIESWMRFSDYGVVLRSVAGSVFGRNILLGNPVGFYMEDEAIIKAVAESGGDALTGLLNGVLPNRIMDSTFLNGVAEIWDQSMVVGTTNKRNTYSIVIITLTMEAWGKKYWETEAWQNTLEFIYDEYGLIIDSPDNIGYVLAQLDLVELIEVYGFLGSQESPEFNLVHTAYWDALTPNERRSGFLNGRRRNIEIKPDPSPYMEEHIENPGAVDEYTWYGPNDEYKALKGARNIDQGLCAFPPLVTTDPLTSDITVDEIYPNDIVDRGGYDMDTIGDGQFGYRIVPVPDDANICRIWGRVTDLGLTVEWVERVEVLFEAVLPEAAGPDPSVITRREVVVKPDYLTGEFTADLARGAEVRVVIQEAGLDQEFTVPDQPTAQLVDLIDV
jgi:hypothetical protein